MKVPALGGDSDSVASETIARLQVPQGDRDHHVGLASHIDKRAIDPTPGQQFNACKINNGMTGPTGEFLDEWTLGSDDLSPTDCGGNIS